MFFAITVSKSVSNLPEESDDGQWQVESLGPASKRMKADAPSANEGSIQCPECQETFMTLVKLHTHAVNTHYYSQLKSLLQPQFKVSLFLRLVNRQP